MGQGAGEAELASPHEVRTNHSLCWQQLLPGSDSLRQAHLFVWAGGLGLTGSAAVTGAAYICCQDFTLGHVLTAVSAHGAPALLERLSKRALARELIVALKEIEEIATEGS